MFEYMLLYQDLQLEDVQSVTCSVGIGCMIGCIEYSNTKNFELAVKWGFMALAGCLGVYLGTRIGSVPDKILFIIAAGQFGVDLLLFAFMCGVLAHIIYDKVIRGVPWGACWPMIV